MKAMVLAAGVGSRLRPLTDRTPKPLVAVGGRPMIETVLRRLRAAGVREVVVNTFHLADELENWLGDHADLGLRIAISREAQLLDTGGGLKQAAWFFDDGRPFFVHNADVLTDLDLGRLYAAHRNGGALATLAVRERPASRLLLFDAHDQLCGWERPETGERTWAAEPVAAVQRLGFDGIQVLSPDFLGALTEEGAFSLTSAYLRLAAAGRRIAAFRADGGFWSDVGSQEKLAAAEQHVTRHGLPG
jgi:NDP-sugar pyrophosphorylase family protein